MAPARGCAAGVVKTVLSHPDAGLWHNAGPKQQRDGEKPLTNAAGPPILEVKQVTELAARPARELTDEEREENADFL